MWKWLALAAAVSAQPPYGLSTGSDAGPRPAVRPAPDHSPPPPPPSNPGDPVQCAAPPTLGKSCTADADCQAVTRIVSCCGTKVITGLRRDEVGRVQAWDRQCNRGRTCGCAEGPTTLDDGTRLDRIGPVSVACRASVCTTFAAPAPAPRRSFTSAEADALPRCPREECPKAPMYPTKECPDGVNKEGRGPCARVDGVCRWVRLECPR